MRKLGRGARRRFTLAAPGRGGMGVLGCVGVCLLVVGCGPSGPAMHAVNGRVTFRGKDLEYGSVMFQPVGVPGAKTARSSIEADGTFTLSTDQPGDGVAIGKNQVRITAFAAQASNARGNRQEELALGASAIPRRFQNFGTSGIEIDVQPDMELPLVINLDDYR